MYELRVEASFDSAHFLSGYVGKCSNIHGHCWRVMAEIMDDKLCEDGQLRGMIVDFSDIKNSLKEIADSLDHKFIYEENTMKQSTVEALRSENFELYAVPFRPTAENFAKYIYDTLAEKGYNVNVVSVYETPNNCASYSERMTF